MIVIELMLKRFKFPAMWVDRVMKCVTTMSYNFLRNGDNFGEVIPKRGARQGDPISPYLYILCIEWLSGMVRQYEVCGLLHGCRIAPNAPSISHLFFADDCYFFSESKKGRSTNVKGCTTEVYGLVRVVDKL